MSERLRWLKPAVFAGGLVPLLAISYQWARGNLGANPIAEALNRLGLVALMLLVCSLACTPLKVVLDWNWPLRVRRMLGLQAFAYATLHVLTYAGLDQLLDLGAILADIVKRPFILVGFLAWLLLVPLALTSTTRMVQRLGFKRWKLLHRLAYVIAVLGVVHFWLRVKADVSEPLTYGVVLGLLFAVRAVDALRNPKRRARRPSAVHV
jgi:methionine sulfoxide reductase heme-binding subunit